MANAEAARRRYRSRSVLKDGDGVVDTAAARDRSELRQQELEAAGLAAEAEAAALRKTGASALMAKTHEERHTRDAADPRAALDDLAQASAADPRAAAEEAVAEESGAVEQATAVATAAAAAAMAAATVAVDAASSAAAAARPYAEQALPALTSAVSSAYEAAAPAAASAFEAAAPAAATLASGASSVAGTVAAAATEAAPALTAGVQHGANVAAEMASELANDLQTKGVVTTVKEGAASIAADVDVIIAPPMEYMADKLMGEHGPTAVRKRQSDPYYQSFEEKIAARAAASPAHRASASRLSVAGGAPSASPAAGGSPRPSPRPGSPFQATTFSAVLTASVLSWFR
jgi:hypothetical protein